MRSLDSLDVLELYTSAGNSGLASRALAILASAMPSEQHVELPLGQRDALLMAVRAKTFGPKFTISSQCPECGEKVVINSTAETVGLTLTNNSIQPAEAQIRRIGAHDVELRPITAGNLAEAETHCDSDRIRQHLLSRCVTAIDGVAGAYPPDAIASPVEDALADLDPLAEIELETSCPICAATWNETFDAADFVWNDIRVEAVRIMTEVAILARFYHWPEREILALPAARRRFYVEATRT
jgi:hypothetical protein